VTRTFGDIRRGVLRRTLRPWTVVDRTILSVSRGDEPAATAKKVLFFRDFEGFRGGHMKVRDYFDHVASTPDFVPFVRFSRRSIWDGTNPWATAGVEASKQTPQSIRPDIFFVGGYDWRALPRRVRRSSSEPVINFVQHIRHADLDDPLSAFLPNRAIRICVAAEISRAILDTGRVNGPVFTIPAAIDVARLDPARRPGHDVDLLIVAVKRPALGAKLLPLFTGPSLSVRLLDTAVPRGDFIEAMRRARVSLYLPNEREGFYLPPLEGMAVGSLVVCPDVVVNRGHCLPGETGFLPRYAEEDLVRDTRAALGASDETRARINAAALRMAWDHDLSVERAQFVDILRSAEELWRSHAVTTSS
jgi:glycosyltransferase involved in cell wall biosynthesis